MNTPPPRGPVQRAFRRAIQPVLRAWLRTTTRLQLEGLHNLPPRGAAIIAFNHLGHLDVLLVVAFSPRPPEFIALADLYWVPGTNLALHAYGVIPIHRNKYNQRTIHAALNALQQGHLLALAPEARQSPSATLGRGQTGAAYLALRSGAPVVPVGITGTQHTYSAWRRCRRPEVSLVVGAPFYVPAQPGAGRREELDAAHQLIMTRIAQLLPAAYRGYWATPWGPGTPEGDT